MDVVDKIIETKLKQVELSLYLKQKNIGQGHLTYFLLTQIPVIVIRRIPLPTSVKWNLGKNTGCQGKIWTTCSN